MVDNLYKWLNTLKGGLTFHNKHNGILAKQVNLSCKESFIFLCFRMYPRVSLNPTVIYIICVILNLDLILYVEKIGLKP